MPLRFSDPKTQEGFIRLALVSPFVHYLRSAGVDPARPIAEMGVAPDAIADPNVFVHADILYGLLNAFAEAAQDPYLGVHVGEYHDFTAWPPYREAFKSSRTVVEFLSLFIRRVPNEANTVEHLLTIKNDGAYYRVRRLHQPNVNPAQTIGFGVGNYTRLLRSLCGSGWDASQVVIRSSHAHAIPLNYAGIRIEPDPTEAFEMRFPADWLFRELPKEARSSAPNQGRTDTVADDVSVVAALRAALRKHIGECDISPEFAARALGINDHRLVKALARKGTTIPKEVKRLKIDIAKEALTENTATIADIGRSVGYTDNAHFARFFKSQTTMTPSQFRMSAHRRIRG